MRFLFFRIMFLHMVLQLPGRRAEGIPDRDINVFMGMIFGPVVIDDKFLARMRLLEEGFQMPEFMHPVKQGVAYKTDAGSLVQLEGQGSLDGPCGLCPIGRLSEHRVLLIVFFLPVKNGRKKKRVR